jgi:hypothetical protein
LTPAFSFPAVTADSILRSDREGAMGYKLLPPIPIWSMAEFSFGRNSRIFSFSREWGLF